jgi:hypothetical protein
LADKAGEIAPPPPGDVKSLAVGSLKLAEQLQADGATWEEASNRLYGVGGPLSKLTRHERTLFFQMPEVAKITAILEKLPERKSEGTKSRSDVNGKILVRVPRSVHAALLTESESEGVSLNQLIVSKLSVQLRASV